MAIAEGQGLIAGNFEYTYTKGGQDIQLKLTDGEDEEYEEDLPLAIMDGSETTLLAEHIEQQSNDATRDDISRETESEDERERDNNEERDQSEEDVTTVESENVDNESISTLETENDDTIHDTHASDEAEGTPTPNITEETEDNITNDQEPEELRTAGEMELRSRRRLDYKAFHSKGARQLAQKVKKAKRKLKRKYKIMVKDMFRKVMKITMSNINAASKHDQVSGISGRRNKAVWQQGN